MARPARAPDTSAFRLLPAVEEVLQRPGVVALAAEMPRSALVELVRALIDAWRVEIQRGELDADGLTALLAGDGLEARLAGRLVEDRKKGLTRVVNASGVVLHTGLGRAPMHPDAARAMAEIAGSYCTLEVARQSGERDQRDDRLSTLLGRLTGSEAGIVVNNNAAAVLLVLQTYGGGGREVIVSRGELVEIGGSFRMPAVMECAGARLREVGTTNRTHMEDYREAIGSDTGLLLKVHTSNYRVHGFVREVSVDELATLGAEAGVPTCFDLGSGFLDGAAGEDAHLAELLDDEPRVRDALSAGVDLVTFSGDKLLGGPQAGLIVGRAKAIAALRKNAVYRAVRLDKVTIAGLERTLELYLDGREGEIPARHMMRIPLAELEATARELAQELGALPGFEANAQPDRSQPGSGSAPGVFIDSWAVRLVHGQTSASALAEALRWGDPSVFGRIQDDALTLDVRTLFPGDAERIVVAARAFAHRESQESAKDRGANGA